MDYEDAYSRERLTGRAYFTPTGATTGVDFGNVQMFKTDFGIKTKEHWKARRGVLFLDRDDAYASLGSWTITADEFVTPLMPYLWLGTQLADFVQAAQTGASFGFNTKKGAVFSVGKYGLFNCSIGSGSLEGTDYMLDRGAGKIYWMLGSAVADGSARALTYSCPSIRYDQATALQVLNQSGTLEIHGEDDSGDGGNTVAADAIPPSRYIFTLPCMITIPDAGTFKPDDYRAYQLKATLTAAMTVKRLQ
jgi:hypothetical protein